MYRKYTVLLLYPESNSTGDETYLAHVKAKSVDDAVFKAQYDACIDNGWDLNEMETLRPLFACTSHKEDLL